MSFFRHASEHVRMEDSAETPPVSAPETTRALQLHRVRAAIARVEKKAPVSAVQEKTSIELEHDFYRQLAHVDEASLSAASMQTLCQESCAVVATRLQEVRNIEAEFYFDLPRTHDLYRKLLAFESSLQSEAVAWRIILELSTLRSSMSGGEVIVEEEILADNDFAFVQQWTKQQDILTEIQAVIRVLEDSYASIHRPELSDASSLIQNPVPARALLDAEISRLNVISQGKKHGFSDEAMFEFIFYALRAGDEKFAKEIAVKSGMVLFVSNFTLRQYSKSWKSAKQSDRRSNRLRWKEVTLASLKNVSMGRWERAVRGILCGNYEAALPVADSWEDEAWIYFTCFLDTVTEKAIAQWRDDLGGSSLPAEIWKSSSSIADIFNRIAHSRSEKIRLRAKSIFPLSICAALVNDVEDALMQIETYILATSLLYPPHMTEEQLRLQNMDSGSGVRFSLHVLLLMRRVGIAVDPVLFGRACYLYVKTTTSRDAEIWACYLAKIPDDSRYDAILHFLTDHLSKVEEKIDFVREMAARDLDNTVAVVKVFCHDCIVSKQSCWAPSDLDFFVGLIGITDRLGIADWLLTVTNFVIRRFLCSLSDGEDVENANDFYLLVGSSIEAFILEPGLVSSNGESAKSEFICWQLYFDVCHKCSGWQAYMDASRLGTINQHDAVAEIKKAALLVGYRIICTRDWLVGTDGAFAENIDLDRDRQLNYLREKTLGQVFSSLIDILLATDENRDEDTDIDQLSTCLDLSEGIMKNFRAKSKDLGLVEESFNRIQGATDRVSKDPRYMHILTRKLKEKIYEFEQSWKRLRSNISH